MVQALYHFVWNTIVVVGASGLYMAIATIDAEIDVS